MGETTPDVLDHLRALSAALTAVRERLAALIEDLPEDDPAVEGHEEPEGGAGLRSVLARILTDSLDPAIRDLLEAAEQEPARPAETSPAVPSRREPARGAETPDYGP